MKSLYLMPDMSTCHLVRCIQSISHRFTPILRTMTSVDHVSPLDHQFSVFRTIRICQQQATDFASLKEVESIPKPPSNCTVYTLFLTLLTTLLRLFLIYRYAAQKRFTGSDGRQTQSLQIIRLRSHHTRSHTAFSNRKHTPARIYRPQARRARSQPHRREGCAVQTITTGYERKGSREEREPRDRRDGRRA